MEKKEKKKSTGPGKQTKFSLSPRWAKAHCGPKDERGFPMGIPSKRYATSREKRCAQAAERRFRFDQKKKAARGKKVKKSLG